MKNTKDIIEKVCGRVLGDWAMMLVDPIEVSGEMFDKERPFYIATVDFKGPIEGYYAIVCQDAFAIELAESLLGEDIDEGSEQDALCEMANVLSGNMITETYGTDIAFDLILPRVHLGTFEQAEKLLNERTVCYMAGDSPVAVTFAVGGPLCL